MKPEQQRIAIAKACGLKKEIGVTGFVRWRDKEGLRDYLPNYCNDLNAMHEAEKTLSCNDKQKYLDILADAPREDIYITCADSVFATAAQRAEAFLRTVGRWKETE
jgi:hypothetical protein